MDLLGAGVGLLAMVGQRDRMEFAVEAKKLLEVSLEGAVG
jgi:hypothetical protein